MPPKKRRGPKKGSRKPATTINEESTAVFSDCIDSDEARNSDDSSSTNQKEKLTSVTPRRSSRKTQPLNLLLSGDESSSSTARRGRSASKRLHDASILSDAKPDSSFGSDYTSQSDEEKEKIDAAKEVNKTEELIEDDDCTTEDQIKNKDSIDKTEELIKDDPCISEDQKENKDIVHETIELNEDEVHISKGVKDIEDILNLQNVENVTKIDDSVQSAIESKEATNLDDAQEEKNVNVEYEDQSAEINSINNENIKDEESSHIPNTHINIEKSEICNEIITDKNCEVVKSLLDESINEEESTVKVDLCNTEVHNELEVEVEKEEINAEDEEKMEVDTHEETASEVVNENVNAEEIMEVGTHEGITSEVVNENVNAEEKMEVGTHEETASEIVNENANAEEKMEVGTHEETASEVVNENVNAEDNVELENISRDDNEDSVDDLEIANKLLEDADDDNFEDNDNIDLEVKKDLMDLDDDMEDLNEDSETIPKDRHLSNNEKCTEDDEKDIIDDKFSKKPVDNNHDDNISTISKEGDNQIDENIKENVASMIENNINKNKEKITTGDERSSQEFSENENSYKDNINENEVIDESGKTTNLHENVITGVENFDINAEIKEELSEKDKEEDNINENKIAEDKIVNQKDDDTSVNRSIVEKMDIYEDKDSQEITSKLEDAECVKKNTKDKEEIKGSDEADKTVEILKTDSDVGKVAIIDKAINANESSAHKLKENEKSELKDKSDSLEGTVDDKVAVSNASEIKMNDPSVPVKTSPVKKTDLASALTRTSTVEKTDVASALTKTSPVKKTDVSSTLTKTSPVKNTDLSSTFTKTSPVKMTDVASALTKTSSAKMTDEASALTKTSSVKTAQSLKEVSTSTQIWADKPSKTAESQVKTKTSETSNTSLPKADPNTKSQTGAAAEPAKNKIPGRAYIIGIRSSTSEGKKTLFDCVLCFVNKENTVPGPVINKHIKSKEHALKVMEISNRNLFDKYKNNEKAEASEIVDAILAYEETQKRQTLVLATKENHNAQRTLIESKISLLRECSLSVDQWKFIEADEENSGSSKKLADVSKTIISTEVSAKSKQVSSTSNKSKSSVSIGKMGAGSNANVSKPQPVPIALSTLNFLQNLRNKPSSLQEPKVEKEEEKLIESKDNSKQSEKKKAETQDNSQSVDEKKRAAQEALSVQLALKQRDRKPNKIVLVMEGRDVFLDPDKLGSNIKVLRKREIGFSNMFDSIKSDDWFDKGTMFVFLNGEYSCMRIRKHSICSQFKCSIPVTVCHIEKDLQASILIDEAMKLHKDILDNTTNDKALFCEMIPINIDANNVLKIDRRVCFSTHPIDFHKKVPSRLMDWYLTCIKEFNIFAKKYAEKLCLPFWDMVNCTFTDTIDDLQSTFAHIKRDGVSFSDTDQLKRSKAIFEFSRALLDLCESSSKTKEKPEAKKKLDTKLGQLPVKKTVVAGLNKSDAADEIKTSFEKIAIIANCYYKEALTNFASSKVEIFADEDLKFDSIGNFITEKAKTLPLKTLWLTLIGSFCISEIKYSDACDSGGKTCVKPLVTLVPSPDVLSSSSMSETINKIRSSSMALLQGIREVLNPQSAFFVLPPYPPTIISESKFLHKVLHEMTRDDSQLYVASDLIIAQLNLAFTKLNKETISLLLSELKHLKYPYEPLETYSSTLPQCHIQIVRKKEDPKNVLFDKWKNCVGELLSKFLGVPFPDKVVDIPVPKSLSPLKETFDHFVFIGRKELTSQISYPSNISLSLWELKLPLDSVMLIDIQTKLSTLKSFSNKPILFVICGDISMIALEVFDYQCNTLKCSTTISYMMSETKKIKDVIEEKLNNIRKLISIIKKAHPTNVKIIMAPLFFKHCIERPVNITETIHRTLHVILKNSCNPIILKGTTKLWEDSMNEFQDIWKAEVVVNLKHNSETMRNIIENYLAIDKPLIQWIKPVVAPLNNNSVKYNIQIIFNKLVEVYFTTKIQTSKPPILFKTSENKNNEPQNTKVKMSESKNSTVKGKLDLSNNIPVLNKGKSQSKISSSTSVFTSSSNTFPFVSSANNTSTNQPYPLSSSGPPRHNYDGGLSMPYNYQMPPNSYNSYEMNMPYYQMQPQTPYPPYYQNQQAPPFMHQQPPPLMQIQQPPPFMQGNEQQSYQYPPSQYSFPSNDNSKINYDATTYSSASSFYSQAVNQPSESSISTHLIPTPVAAPVVETPVVATPVAVTSTATAFTETAYATQAGKVKAVSMPTHAPYKIKSTKPIEIPSFVSSTKTFTVNKEQALVNFLTEFSSSERLQRPFEYTFIIGKKEIIAPLSKFNLKKVTLIYQNLSSIDEGQVTYLLNKIGKIPNKSVCFLAFGLSVITKTTPITEGCQKFKCKQPVPGSSLKSQSKEKSTNLSIIKRIKEIVNLSSKLGSYLPVVILPVYPSRAYCDASISPSSHKISHAIAEKDSYVLIGETKVWEEHIGIFLQTWNNFMKVHHDKSSFPKVIPKFPYLKNTITFGENVNYFFEDYGEPAIWEDTVSTMLKILMTYPENLSQNIKSTVTVVINKETALSTKQDTEKNEQSSSHSENHANVAVKISNMSDSIPEEFFTTLFTTIYSRSSIEKNDDHYIVILTRVSAVLIVNKLNNYVIGDRAVKVEFVEPQADIPELTFAQAKYMSVIFNEIYLRYKSQIAQNIKTKVTKVIDSTNYKTELCDGSCNGDNSSCNFYHNSNDRRRNPVLYKYKQKICTHPNTKFNPCSRFDSCLFSHNIYEQMFYPTNFQTILCSTHEKNSVYSICKFAHKETPEVFYTSSWQDAILFGTQTTFQYFVGAIRAIHKLSVNKDVNVCLISQSTELLDIAELVISDLLLESKFRCANLTKGFVNSRHQYQVFIGTPHAVANYQGEILSPKGVGALIVDDIKGILDNILDGESLLKICQKFKISSAFKSPINKVFIAKSYDSTITGIISRFLGVQLIEIMETARPSLPYSLPPSVKQPDHAPTLVQRDRKTTPISVSSTSSSSSSSSSSSGLNEKSSSRIRRNRSFSRSRSRSKSRSRRKRSSSRSRKRSVSRSRRSRSTSRSRRHRSGSRSRRNRSSSRSRRNKSRSRSGSRSRSRRNRSNSRSRRNRSSSKTSHSRSSQKTQPSVQQKTLGKRNLSPTPDLPKTKRIKDEAVLPQGFSNPVRNETFSAKNFIPVPITPPIKVNIPKPPENIKSLQDKVGEHLYNKFLEHQKTLQSTHEEEYRAFAAFPELHSSYEMFYEEFLSDYYKTYGMNKADDHKDKLWKRFWSTRVQVLKELEWRKKKENMEKEFLTKVKTIKASQSEGFPVNPMASTSKPISRTEESESFSVEKTITLLEKISTKLGMLGPALLAIVSSARELGIKDKGLNVFTDEENLTLLKMVTDKMKTLQKTSPPALVLDLRKALHWTDQLLQHAKNQPMKEKGLNLLAIANASVGKDSAFTLNLIRTALAYEGLPPKSKEEINEMFLNVCKIHFEMAMEDK